MDTVSLSESVPLNFRCTGVTHQSTHLERGDGHTGLAPNTIAPRPLTPIHCQNHPSFLLGTQTPIEFSYALNHCKIQTPTSRVSYPCYHCDRTLDKSNLRKLCFVLAYGLRRYTVWHDQEDMVEGWNEVASHTAPGQTEQRQEEVMGCTASRPALRDSPSPMKLLLLEAPQVFQISATNL